MLVIACNTATVAALDVLQNELDIPVIGVIESGVKAGITNSKNKNIGIIGTQRTILSNEYEIQIKSFHEDATVQSIACPLLVSIVEDQQFNSSFLKELISRELSPFSTSKIDTLVLGCTHFPLLQNYIQDYLGNEVIVIDPSVETSKKVKLILESNNLINNSKESKYIHQYYTTGSVNQLEFFIRSCLKLSSFSISSLSLSDLTKFTTKKIKN